MKNVYILTLLVISAQQASTKLLPQSCPQRCQCQEELQLVSCVNVPYTSISESLPASIEQLLLDNVTVQRLSRDTLQIETETSLRQLQWINSDIEELTQEFLAKFTNVESVDLSRNKIQTIPNNVFTNLSLKRLNLSRNEITQVEPNAFDSLDSLEALYLSENRLQLIRGEHIFKSLWQLTTLDLSHNQIKMIDNYFFLYNKKLTHLYLNHNHIEHLSPNAFVNINLLSQLDLSHNSIATLPPTLFQDLRQLECLNISHNALTSVINSTLSNVVNLKYLDLSSNVLSSPLSDSTLSTNVKLEYLCLDDTKLTSLKTELLRPLTRLVHLSISHNTELSHLDNELFYDKPQLSSIDLSYNALPQLPHSLTALSNLSLVNINSNPWICDCQMAWFAEWWTQHRRIILPNDKHQEKCKSTIYADLVNTSLISTLRALNCTPAIITSSTPSGFYWPLQNVTLDCVVKGEPTPTITWLTPQGWTFHWVPEYSVNPTFKHHPTVHNVHLRPVDQTHLFLLHNGSLLITQFDRGDRGNYSCFVSNPFSNSSRLVSVQLDPLIVYKGKLLSIAFGTLCACLFLGLTLLVQLIICMCRRCCQRRSHPNQIQIMLDNIEQCRSQQLNKLQENYSLQVSKIKENYVFQVEKIREGYKDQVESLRTIKRNGTSHLVSLREQYCDQMTRVRDYSTGQLNWVRENYIFQRNRVRKFKAHQMLRIRENYKYQQQALNKMLESLPTLDNCKGSCGYSMSTVYDEHESTVHSSMPGPARGGPSTTGGVTPGDIQLNAMLVTSTSSESKLSLYFTPTETSLSPVTFSPPLTSVHRNVSEHSLDSCESPTIKRANSLGSNSYHSRRGQRIGIGTHRAQGSHTDEEVQALRVTQNELDLGLEMKQGQFNSETNSRERMTNTMKPFLNV